MRTGTRIGRAIGVVVIIMVLFASCVTYSPMIDGDPVQTEKVFGGYTYSQNEEYVAIDTMVEVLEQYEQVVPYIAQYERAQIGGLIFSVGGSLTMIGGSVASMAGAWGVGLGSSVASVILYGISFGFQSRAHRALSTGVEIYNDQL